MTALAVETLSPAKKAWLTRRRLAEERVEIEARKQEIRAAAEAASPLAGVKLVRMWCDEPRIGCGQRVFVVIDIGPRWAQLFYPPLLCTWRVDRVDFDKHAKAAGAGASAGRTADIIKRRIVALREMAPDDCELASWRGERAIAMLDGRRDTE